MPNWVGHERHKTEYVLDWAPDLIVMSEWRASPWTDIRTARAGFYAEWLLLQEIGSGRAPYEIRSFALGPEINRLAFQRVGATAKARCLP